MGQVTGRACVFALGLSLFSPAFAFAQEAAAPSGTPNATTSIPGDQIPPLPLPFDGVITDRGSESTPWWPPRVVPPKGAPNVLLILTDDEGYGVYSTFGGVRPAPALESVAAEGLRYTQFHSKALFSPTRATLLTGRNHHSVGFGIVSEGSTGYLRQIDAAAPDQPFFLDYAPGGTHSPHQPTQEWIDGIRAMHLFDEGWNALRDTIHANQKRLGVIPQDALLTAWPETLPKWESLSAEQRKLYVRQAEIFAAYGAYKATSLFVLC